jgi:hypothetical protein
VARRKGEIFTSPEVCAPVTRVSSTRQEFSYWPPGGVMSGTAQRGRLVIRGRSLLESARATGPDE